MQHVTLPGSGRRTSQLGFGCSGIMGALGRRRSLAILESAFDAGIRHFDVAPLYGYGAAEGCLGEFAVRHAGHVTIATKFGLEPPRRAGLRRSLRRLANPLLHRVPQLRMQLRDAAAPKNAPARQLFHVALVRAALERSLRALRVDSIDLFLLHEAESTDDFDPDLEAFLVSARNAGKIGAFGCASERAKIVPLYTALPGLCNVLEYNWSPHTLLPDTKAFRVQHRVFAEHLSALPQVIPRPQDQQEFSPAQLLLRAALLSNTAGIVLFSSSREAHIRHCADAASRTELAAPAARLLAAMRSAEPSAATAEHRSTLANLTGAGYPEGQP